MPKDRKLTYSDRQAQAARDKKIAQKKQTREDSNPAPVAPKATRKR